MHVHGDGLGERGYSRAFDNVADGKRLTTLAGTADFLVSYVADTIIELSDFAPLLAGDFDIDGDVDGADFLRWQHDPSVGLLSDWETNFAMSLPLAAASAAVPELAIAVLSLAMLRLVMTGRRSV